MTKAALLALALGLAALAVPPHPLGEGPAWETLLAPYSTGAPVLGGFRVDDIRRGADNGVVISLRRPDDGAAVEVLVVERGRWKSVHESQSFTIDYELPRSPAPERDAVTRVLADTIRSRDAGLPSPDAIPLRASDLSVLPWALEMLRGVRGVVFGASLVLFALIAIHRSWPLSAVGLALGATSLGVRLSGVPLLRPDLGGVWMLPASGVLILLALRSQGLRPRSGTVPVLAVTVLTLALRLALGPWGPLHVNGHGARFIAGAAGGPEGIAAYGPGYAELFGPIVALLPSSPDWAIFACNAVFSALMPALGFVIGRLTAVPANAALAAATLLAVDPIGIRMGATEAYFIPIAFLCTSASAVLLLAAYELDGQRRWNATALLVSASLLLSLAARIHPCAWVLMATVPFVSLASTAGTWRLRVLVLFAVAVVSGGVLLSTSASVLLDVLGNIRTGAIFRPDPPSPWPLCWIALGAIVYSVLTKRGWIALSAGIAIAAMVTTRQAFAASWIWEQSFFRLYLTLPLLAVLAWLGPPLLRRRWTVVAATALLILAWSRFALPIVSVRSTEQLEYRWVREHIRRLPAECRLIYVGSAGKRFLALPTYVAPSREAVAMDLRRASTIEAALSPAACLVYLRTSLCSTPEGRPDCDEIERRLALVPIASTSFAASGEFETFSHDRDPVEAAMARVERVAR